jgi:hypothetical protein
MRTPLTIALATLGAGLVAVLGAGAAGVTFAATAIEYGLIAALI